jgi:hypothetical protein
MVMRGGPKLRRGLAGVGTEVSSKSESSVDDLGLEKHKRSLRLLFLFKGLGVASLVVLFSVSMGGVTGVTCSLKIASCESCFKECIVDTDSDHDLERRPVVCGSTNV